MFMTSETIQTVTRDWTVFYSITTSGSSSGVNCMRHEAALSVLILIIKPTRCTNSQIYFWDRTLHVSDRFSVYHQESSTVYTAIDIRHTGYAD